MVVPTWPWEFLMFHTFGLMMFDHIVIVWGLLPHILESDKDPREKRVSFQSPAA